MPHTPIFCEFPAHGAPGVIELPWLGPTAGTGARWGLSTHGKPAGELAAYWCGENGERCTALARRMSLLEPNQRVVFLDGSVTMPPKDATAEYADAVWAATVETLGRCKAACDGVGAPITGFISDAEYAGPNRTAERLGRLLYGSGLFSPRETWCAAWNVWFGYQDALNEWGKMIPTPGLVDGRTSVVHGYLRQPEVPGVYTSGVSIAEQCRRILDHARKAVNAGHRVVPLLATVNFDHERKPYAAADRPYVRAMFAELGRMAHAVWLFNPAFQRVPPYAEPWPGAAAAVRKQIDESGTIDAREALNRVETLCYDAVRGADYAAVQAEMVDTVAALRGDE